jgi:hypothetical protein
VVQPGSGNATYTDLGDISPDMTNNPSGTNTTGLGVGRVFIADKDITGLKGYNWSFSDGGHYYAFVHYLFEYDVNGGDPMLVGDGLSFYSRWQIPAGADTITWP